MKRPLVVRPEAEKELAKAYEWYKEQVQGLGSDFLLHVEAALSFLQRSLQSYPVVNENIHRCLARRFPDGVFYLVDKESLVALGILHARRDSRAWRDRAREPGSYVEGGGRPINCKRWGTNENSNTLLFGYPFYLLLLLGVRGDRTGDAFGLQAHCKSKSLRR
jgi:toxin ParE1/3/4